MIELTCTGMLNILKYIQGVQGVDDAPYFLALIPDELTTQKMWKDSVEDDPRSLAYVPDYLKNQEICEWVVYKNSWMLKYVPDHFKTQEMCDDVVIEDPLLLRHVPDWFVTKQQQWQCDDTYYDGYIEWCNGYKKRKAQKARTKEKLLDIAWHLDRAMDWRVEKTGKGVGSNR